MSTETREDHYTANSELVDLSVAHMHQHPASRRADGIAMPPLWWDDVGAWPPVIRYLPDSPGQVGFPDAKDVEDLETFMDLVMIELDRVLAEDEVGQVTFGPMLSSIADMDTMTDQGHPWLVRAIAFQERGSRFPAWIEQRHEELTAAWRSGVAAPSRLRGVDGLLK